MRKEINFVIITALAVLIYSCNNRTLDVDVDDINISFKTQRFEKDLFNVKYSNDFERVQTLRNKYGEFFNLYIFKILNIPEGNDSVIADNLRKFVEDSEVKDIYRLTDSAYNSVDEIQAGIESFLKHHKYYFPEKPIPSVVTFISAFNYAVITTDSTIGIGLDMFLGSDVGYYPRLGVPRYLFTKFRREYIVPSVIKAWFQSDYDQANVKNELLSQMVYQGKMQYYINAMAPDIQDSLRTGYSSNQLKWCEENEGNIWSFFIENKLLFNTDPSEFSKFVNDGPTTNGFPKESPGKIGAWIGLRIVEAYMKKQGNSSLADLLKENDAQKILEVSGYKPKK